MCGGVRLPGWKSIAAVTFLHNQYVYYTHVIEFKSHKYIFSLKYFKITLCKKYTGIFQWFALNNNSIMRYITIFQRNCILDKIKDALGEEKNVMIVSEDQETNDYNALFAHITSI